MATDASYERLGAFYLGRVFDPEQGETTDEAILYDSRDLTTHAVCVGMTGSGKTGLCLDLLEEAAIDGIPAIAIDPKGDLGNLMLTFPKLRPEDFRPWIDEGEALRKGRSVDEHATATADLWRQGLADWGQSPARIARFRDAVDIAIYTPGSDAGLPLAALRSFDAPPAEILADGEALRERILATVSGLLGLLGVDGDPLRSREHVFLANLLEHAWRAGENLDLGALIRAIQSPPFERLGVLELETFFPANDRFALAMRLNSLLASPSFASWLEGEPLDVQKLLYTAEGKPRLAILSIAHLSDAERMFFVTTLLNEVIAWMRRQSGTSSLRALLYMDEVFGYLPPTANPPSKTPLLTLLKQARAFGLGCVLATQNPVDLDYKALSNAGTWLLGRLQTERDLARVLDGLEGASASTGARFDRRAIETQIAGLEGRTFLMNNVHEDAPVLFKTRWALSYLRGPLTRQQIRQLMADRKRQTAAAPAPQRATEKTSPSEVGGEAPVLPPGVEALYLPTSEAPPENTAIVYDATLLAKARLHFVSARQGIDTWRDIELLIAVDDAVADDWSSGERLESCKTRRRGAAGARYGELPSEAGRKTSYRSWAKKLRDHLYREETLALWKAPALKLTSEAGEEEGVFRIRCTELARERRDLAIEKLRAKHGPKLARLEERIRKAEERVQREEEQYKDKRMGVAISIGTSVLGALFGRKKASIGNLRRAGSAARGMSRAAKERGDIARSEQRVAELQEDLSDLAARFEEEVADLRDTLDPTHIEIEAAALRARKSEVSIERLTLAWAPSFVDESGRRSPAY